MFPPQKSYSKAQSPFKAAILDQVPAHLPWMKVITMLSDYNTEPNPCSRLGSLSIKLVLGELRARDPMLTIGSPRPSFRARAVRGPRHAKTRPPLTHDSSAPHGAEVRVRTHCHLTRTASLLCPYINYYEGTRGANVSNLINTMRCN